MSNDRFAAIAANYENLFTQVWAVQNLDYAHYEKSVFDEVNKTPFITGRILDVGCGDGATSAHFVDTGCNIRGIDLNQEMITAYNKRFGNKAKAQIGDATNMKDFQPGDLDVIVTAAAIHNIPKAERKNFWKEILRLAPKMIVMGEKIADPDAKKHRESYESEIRAIEEVYTKRNNLPKEYHTWLDHYVYDERERLEFAEIEEALGEAYELEIVFEMGMYKIIRGLRK